MLFALLRLLFAAGASAFGFRLGGGQILLPVLIAGVAEELIEERERRRLAVLLVIVAAVLLLPGEHSLQRAERLRHFAAQVFEIIVGDAHALHHVVHRLDAERTRAFQAQTFIDGISVFDLRDEDHGKIFLAF